jgi:hypothetical protein
VVANDVQQVLYNPELSLFWFMNSGRLWALDLKSVGNGVASPVLVASGLGQYPKLSVQRAGQHFTGPGQSQDDWQGLLLHWEVEPFITGGEAEGRIDGLDGRAWLAGERSRPVRAEPAWAEFDVHGPHAPLPSARAECDETEICGAALPFGESWQLVVAGDQSGDFEHHFCLLYDPTARAFATPPSAATWGDAAKLESGSCGPYFFNTSNDAYFHSSTVCRVGGPCVELDDAYAEGWVVPGAGVGQQ